MYEVDYDVLDVDKVDVFLLDNANAAVLSNNTDYVKSLRNHFTDKVENCKFMPQFKAGLWDGQIKHMRHDGLLPVGLLGELNDKCKEWDIPVVYHNDTREKLDVSDFETVIQYTLIKYQENKMKPYDHQWDIAKTLISNKRGVAKSATGSGKTYTMAMMCKYLIEKELCNKILIIVPTVDLVVQGQRDYVELGWDIKDVGMYFGQVKDEGTPVVFSTWQSIQNIKDNEWFEQYDCVIGDEVHKAGSGAPSTKSKAKKSGTVFKQCIDKCINAEFRFGLTGTIPKGRLDQRTIKGCIGDVLVEYNVDYMIENKHVSDITIVLTMVDYKDIKGAREQIKENRKQFDAENKTAGYAAERMFIESYVPRYRMMTKIINSCLKKDENVLILANTVDFGKKLKKAIEHKCKLASRVEHIYGEMDIDTRQEIIKHVESNERCVIVATTSLFSTGVSIKNLHSAILGHSGKAFVTTIQSVGRLLRKHDSKNKAKLFDIIDTGLKYSESHGAQRVEFYDQEKFDNIIYEVEI